MINSFTGKELEKKTLENHVLLDPSCIAPTKFDHLHHQPSSGIMKLVHSYSKQPSLQPLSQKL